MKITDIKAVYPKWTKLPESKWQSRFWQIVVRVEADTGDVGYGYGGGGEAGCLVINRHMRELLVGTEINSVNAIQHVWDRLYHLSLPYGRKGLAVMALSGVDLALWDLLARAQGLPVHRLIGGRSKDAARAYATGANVEKYRDMGFSANKFPPAFINGSPDYVGTEANARRARTALGDKATIMTDCYMGWDVQTTTRMAQLLSEFNLYWFEDLVTPDHLLEQAALKPVIAPIKIAGGEHEVTRFGFKSVLDSGALDIWQPDLTWCGGITEGLRILDLALSNNIPVVPHRGGEPWGLHFIVSTGCEDLAETMPERWDIGSDVLWVNEPHVIDGYIRPTDEPGFGVRLNEAMI